MSRSRVHGPLRVAIDGLQIGRTPAGVGRYVIDLLRALDASADDEHEITAYVPRSARLVTEWTPERLHIVPVADAGGSAQRILRQQLVLPQLMKNRYDVVHYPDYLVPLRRPAPCILTLHDMAYAHDASFFTGPQRAVRRMMNPIGVRAARLIAADSGFTRTEVLRLFPDVPPDRIRVVYPGVHCFPEPSEDACESVRARLRLPDRFVLSVCTREPRKNLGRLLHAFGQCADLAHEYLVLVGSPGWGDDATSVLTSYGRRLADRVIVTGYVEELELSALYRMASAFVYVSLLEGFGFPLLEAMSCGVPVVASNIPVLREVGGPNAVYVDPLDVEQIGHGIASLLGDAQLRAQLARGGVERAGRFSWARCAAQMLALYGEVA